MTFRFGYTEAAILVVVAFLGLAMVFLPDYDRPPIESVQNGFRGTGMLQVYNPRSEVERIAENQLPEIAGLPPLITAGPTAAQSYQNVQVLGDLSTAQFLRLMTAITAWVSPEQGCNYCHVSEGFQHDDLYTKRVSRWMIHMTRDLNTQWASHVQNAWDGDANGAGVNCWTCHRGNNVPEYVWYYRDDLDDKGMIGYRAGQNRPAESVALASLPADPFSIHLTNEQTLNTDQIRVQGGNALPAGNRKSIKQAELTYALMMHMSTGLGVNCTYCHNTQNFGAWSESPPQRTTAWYGIQMAQAVNSDYILPSKVALPDNRLHAGNPSMVYCATCHQEVYKPLYGANMIEDWPSLATPNYVDRATIEPGLASAEASEAIGAELKAAGQNALYAPSADPKKRAAIPSRFAPASAPVTPGMSASPSSAPAAATQDRAAVEVQGPTLALAAETAAR